MCDSGGSSCPNGWHAVQNPGGACVPGGTGGTSSNQTASTGTASTPAASTGPPSADAVKQCLQRGGYAVLGAQQTSIPPSGALPSGASSQGPADLGAFENAINSPGVSGQYEITKPGIDATIAVYLSDADAQAAGAPNTGAVAGANFQPRSAGDVAFVQWKGDPSTDIAGCAGS